MCKMTCPFVFQDDKNHFSHHWVVCCVQIAEKADPRQKHGGFGNSWDKGHVENSVRGLPRKEQSFLFP